MELLKLISNEYYYNSHLEPDEAGVIRSRIFPGLNLKVTSLLRGDLAQVLAEVHEGVGTQVHQVFVEQLLQRRSLYETD